MALSFLDEDYGVSDQQAILNQLSAFGLAQWVTPGGSALDTAVPGEWYTRWAVQKWFQSEVLTALSFLTANSQAHSHQNGNGVAVPVSEPSNILGNMMSMPMEDNCLDNCF